MNPKALISRLESADPSEGRRILSQNGKTEGLSFAFFSRTIELLSIDPSAAARFAGHWRALLEFGDDRGLTYRAKAVGERASGDWVKSVQSFKMAGAATKDSVAKLSFQTGAVDSLARAGKVDEAVALGARLARGLDKHGRTDLAARVRLNVGNALLWRDLYRRARGWFQKALTGLGAPEFERERAAALLGVSGCSLFGGDLIESTSAAEEAKRSFESIGDTFSADLCRLNVAHTSLLAGKPDEALATLLELRDAISRSSETDAARVEEFLGDAYLVLNMHEEALEAFQSALASPTNSQTPLNRTNRNFGVGLAHLGMGDANAARPHLLAASRAYDRLGNETWAGAARVVLSEALLALGRTKQAIAQSEAALRQLEKSGSPYQLCKARLAHGSLTAGSDNRPHDLVLAAARVINARGYHGLAWQVSFIRARAAHDARQKRSIYRRMFREILEARLATSSVVSRAAYMRDKTVALSAYLDALLAPAEGLSSRHARALVKEAIGVVSRSRSVALIDEILSSSGATLSEEVSLKLSEIRAEINIETDADIPGSTIRRAPMPRGRLNRLRRRWFELNHSAGLFLGQAHLPAPNAVVFAEAQGGYYAIRNGLSTKLPISKGELDASLQWFEFDLLAPMAERDASSRAIMESLCDLKRKVLDPWLGESVSTMPISPDGALWNVPWQALLNLETEVAEPILLPSPLFGAEAGNATLPANPKAAIWSFGSESLPHVRAETEAFLNCFPGAAVAVTTDDAMAMMESRSLDLLHVAGHSVVRFDNPMFSSIELAGGRIYAADIARSHLGVRLVTLSACDTGRLSFRSKMEPDGLVRAFMSRGAQAVVASAWPLDDLVASEMMTAYYRELSSKKTLKDSLRAARATGRQIQEHPYFWAPLVLFGGYVNRDK